MQGSRASFTTRGEVRRQVEGFSASGDRTRDPLVDLASFFSERGYESSGGPSKYWEERLVTIGSVVVPKWVPVKEKDSNTSQTQEEIEVLVGLDALYYPNKPPPQRTSSPEQIESSNVENS
eukprot:jgi/Galph1/4012/GphlegSOOS_G2654.1